MGSKTKSESNFTLVRIENGRTLCTDMQAHDDKYIGIGASFKAKVWKTRRGVEMKKLSPAQDSIMRGLAKTNGYSPIYGGTPLASYYVLERRGLITIDIQTPVSGSVRMTDEGKRLYPLKHAFCLKCDEEKPVHEAACLHCGELAPWARD